jgi:hypothetical protein
MAKHEKADFFAPQWAFTPYMVAQLPELAGVFALWEQKELIYIGRAVRPASLRSVLEAHLHGRHPCTARASHYAWQLSLDPAHTERELLAEYRTRHRMFPRCNRLEE